MKWPLLLALALLLVLALVGCTASHPTGPRTTWHGAYIVDIDPVRLDAGWPKVQRSYPGWTPGQRGWTIIGKREIPVEPDYLCGRVTCASLGYKTLAGVTLWKRRLILLADRADADDVAWELCNAAGLDVGRETNDNGCHDEPGTA